jgi:hypothetical protein
MRLASFAQRSCGAATNSMRMAALSTTFEPAGQTAHRAAVEPQLLADLV